MKAKGTFASYTGIAAGLLALAWSAQAQQFTGHYPAGAEGIKAASLPPPGLYLRDYNIFYQANVNKDSGLSDFNSVAYVQAPRVIWMTPWTIPVINASYGMDLLIPFYYTDVKITRPDGTKLENSTTFAMGDLQFEPLLLAWHGKRWDAGAGHAFWAPTGNSSEDLSQFSRVFSRGYWGHMFTVGGTWYLTEDKSWAVSLLNRYEINMEKELNLGGQPYEVTPGNHYTLEWGISKTVHPNIDVGVVGYYAQQTTADSVSNVPQLDARRNLYDRVLAVGPEISAFIPKMGMFASVRYLREFAASDSPEGNKVTLTLTKRW